LVAVSVGFFFISKKFVIAVKETFQPLRKVDPKARSPAACFFVLL
jgi:hypothetical protein